jgi:hypothetical protein
MGFSAKQVMALKRNLNARQIRTREAHGRELSYIEGWLMPFCKSAWQFDLASRLF